MYVMITLEGRLYYDIQETLQKPINEMNETNLELY